MARKRGRKPGVKPPEKPEPERDGDGRVVSAARKAARDLVRDIAGLDPLEALAAIAMGDCVRLGWLTPREAAGTAGRGRAMRLIGPSSRIGAWFELANYVHPKLKAIERNPDDKPAGAAVVQFVFPSNGREPAPAIQPAAPAPPAMPPAPLQEEMARPSPTGTSPKKPSAPPQRR